MSSVIVETPSFDASPAVIDDGDALDAAHLRPPHQVWANRTAYLRKLVEETGVRRVQYFASIQAMKADASHAIGDIAVVGTTGVYRFDTAHVGWQEVSPTVIVAGAGQGGTWEMVGAGWASRDVANGFAKLDDTGRVPFTRVRNAIVESGQAKITAGWSQITGSGGVVVGISATTGQLAPGDIIEADASLVCSLIGNGAQAHINLRTASTNIASTVIGPAAATSGGQGGPYHTIHITGARFLTTGNNIYTLTLYVSYISGTLHIAGTDFGPNTASMIRYRVIRP